MSNTSSSSGANSSTRSQAPSGHQTANFRSPADTSRQNNMFRKELDRMSKPEQKNEGEKKDLEKKGEKQKASNAVTLGRQANLEGRGRRGGQSDNGEQQGSGTLSDTMTNALFRAEKLVGMQKISAPQLPSEHLARIAAAIQELANTGINASYRLQLPLGNGMIEGAILGRDPSGQLAIQLISSGALSIDEAAQLRHDLMRRFEKKRMKVAMLNVTARQQTHNQPEKN